jgi:hypothetical protein
MLLQEEVLETAKDVLLQFVVEGQPSLLARRDQLGKHWLQHLLPQDQEMHDLDCCSSSHFDRTYRRGAAKTKI